MDGAKLKEAIERLLGEGERAERDEVRATVAELLAALESGAVRAAAPENDHWVVNQWVRAGILLGFRHSDIVRVEMGGAFGFADKHLFLPRHPASMPGARLVPGGSAVRRGAHIGAGVILMPPCYVNVGAFVDEGSMIDSHALVGSCAQIGKRVHLSAGAQIGGVLEPPGAMPVVVEDGCFVGALAGVLEGVHVRRGAVLGAGVILTASMPVYDVPRRRILHADARGVLEIPERAVVVAGSRPMADPWAAEMGVRGAAAVIVKDRDEGTDARAALEDALR
ncbi:MAG: 2,3,4,5-tetrahydropyridine-2,6-dicarboxylate N-succinyltransferase [Candidatus Polarisedimenticolia bacterium]|nr:2,3,4,5-tetrahydropyridine-2,6-dicarboxylate N-succinyltransferase [bacterium]